MQRFLWKLLQRSLGPEFEGHHSERFLHPWQQQLLWQLVNRCSSKKVPSAAAVSHCTVILFTKKGVECPRASNLSPRACSVSMVPAYPANFPKRTSRLPLSSTMHS